MSAGHVAIGSGGRFQCNHCGAVHDPFKGEAVELWAVAALGEAFTKQHARCPAPKVERCHFCFSQEHASNEHVNVTTATAVDWIDCGDTGLSSTAIWKHMMGAASSGDYPYDPDDFGRCFRLLAAPWARGWRERMPEMARYGKVWAALATEWPKLEALFVKEAPTGKAPKLYAAMKKARAAGGAS